MLDEEICYRAASSKDARFDGMFYIAVKTTHIYCRPSCPARTPRRENVIFVSTPASAQLLGFRACKRCRPDAAPGSPEWNIRNDVVGRAMRLIADGLVEREGVTGLAEHLHYSERQLRRVLTDELGAGPLGISRARRADAARVLLESSTLQVSQVAFAAGFSSIRQFNDTIRQVFALTPSALRERAARKEAPSEVSNALSLRLAHREPFDHLALLEYLGRRAVPGIEEVQGSTYRRVLDLPGGPAIIGVDLDPTIRTKGTLRADLWLSDLRDLNAAVSRSRRLFDLDADPVAIDAALGDDEVLGDLVRERPGRRVPCLPSGPELAMRALIGQQISVLGARTLLGRLVARYGTPLNEPHGTLTHVFPRADVLAEVEPSDLPMPDSRKATFIALNRSLAKEEIVLDEGSDRHVTREQLLAIKGIGPWTAEYIAMRALGDPDAFLSGDLGVRQAFVARGLANDEKSIDRYSQRWRPWRAYALMHLWTSLSLIEKNSKSEQAETSRDPQSRHSQESLSRGGAPKGSQ